jgi:hypothetical protein
VHYHAKRIGTKALMQMKKVVGILSVFALAGLICVGIWVCWVFQPWMPAGRAVHLSTEHIGDYDFQVWQRKNALFGEPFATGLFARKQGGPWKVFLLDFQDNYRSLIILRRQGSGVAVLQDKRKLGLFDETQEVFMRDYSGGDVRKDMGDVLNSEPPANWWLKQADK